MIKWVLGHKGVEGNEKADQAAKRAATKPTRNQAEGLSLAFVSRVVTKAREETRQA